jgi:hypothetical protein
MIFAERGRENADECIAGPRRIDGNDARRFEPHR